MNPPSKGRDVGGTVEFHNVARYLVAICRDWGEVEKLAHALVRDERVSDDLGDPGSCNWVLHELASALFTIHDEENK